MSSWADERRAVRARLEAGGVDDAEVEARWLVEEASGYDTSEWSEASVHAPPQRARDRLADMVERRLAREPLQYVLGSWSFGGLDLMVDRRVLIPRPETEVVAELAIDEAERQGAERRRLPAHLTPRDPVIVADLGTGSGAIALSVAAVLNGVEVWATDRDADALKVARANAAGNALAGIEFAHGSWFEALPVELRGAIAVVVSNPPYVSEAEFADLPPEVRDCEPRAALIPGPAGTEALEYLVRVAPEWLRPGGALVLEHAPHQADFVADAATRAGFASVSIRNDLNGRRRALLARRSR